MWVTIRAVLDRDLSYSHSGDHSRSVTFLIAIIYWGTLDGCNIMWLAICRQRQCHVSIHSPTESSEAGECGQVGEGERVSALLILYRRSCTVLVGSCRLQLQAYNTGQATPAIRLHSWPLLVSQWEKRRAVLQLSMAWWKKTLSLFTRGHWHCDYDHDQMVSWRYDHRPLKWSDEHSPCNNMLPQCWQLNSSSVCNHPHILMQLGHSQDIWCSVMCIQCRKVSCEGQRIGFSKTDKR